MKIKTNVTSQVEKDIELPYFCKYTDNYFLKVISEKRYIQVNTYDFNTGIDVYSLTPGILPQCTPCTEQEFNEAFDKAFAAIQQLQEVLS